MIDQDQIKALAELDGCYKPYLTSYDAIIPLIQKQPLRVKEAIWVFVLHMLNVGQHRYDTTASQLCEALLRATGKWKE